MHSPKHTADDRDWTYSLNDRPDQDAPPDTNVINTTLVGYVYHVFYAVYTGVLYAALTITATLLLPLIAIPIISSIATLTAHYIGTQDGTRTLRITAAGILTCLTVYTILLHIFG